MEDDGTITLEWGVPGLEKLNRDSPIMIGVPGLTSDANNVVDICQLGAQNGFRIVVFKKRGLGHSPLTSPKLQSFGDPHDLRYLVQFVRQRYPNSHIVAVGSSAGCGVLASYLAEYWKDLDISVCVLFCSPHGK